MDAIAVRSELINRATPDLRRRVGALAEFLEGEVHRHAGVMRP
jgi:hypothetical protein